MRTAISAGALALALGGGISAIAASPVSAAVQLDDCPQGGVLGTVTGGLCKTVNTLGDVVGGLTNGITNGITTLKPGTGTADARTLDTATETTENSDTARAADTARTGDTAAVTSPAPSATAAPAPYPEEESSDGGLLPKVLDGVCLPLTASPECTGSSALVAPDPSEIPATPDPEQTAEPSGSPSPSPSQSPSPERTREDTAPLPAEPPLPPETRTLTTDVGRPVTSEPSPVVDAEAPRVELLWPGPLMQEFQRQMPERRPLKPTQSSDSVGTVLSTALLTVAILAVRLLYTRRTGEESMPFEPLRVGRHRIA